METVVLVIHLILALSIILLILLQRSEGGGLGIGGGSGGLGGFATAGQTANVLTRATAICAACFFATSLLLAVLAGSQKKPADILESLDNVPAVIDSSAAAGDKENPEAKGAGKESQPPSVPISE
ncbi:MAG: preprotein translocase subunit SecG [Rhodospirillales bacterium]|nr:preprotein translocase subunit SecG [Alphaproteobacteria bacterium]USO03321.1 MAG: preprotein translocase subunit SecG [Rhodospirillales bacterium]